jgi:hypothetical protein
MDKLKIADFDFAQHYSKLGVARSAVPLRLLQLPPSLDTHCCKPLLEKAGSRPYLLLMR